MSVPAWPLPAGLPAREITGKPRIRNVRGDSAGDDGALAGAGRLRRVQSPAAASRRGTPAASGWVRAQSGGPARVIAAGDGSRADQDSTGPVIPPACPAGDSHARMIAGTAAGQE